MTSELKQALEWIDEAALALDAAITIGQRSCNSGDHLHYANHERLIASKPVLAAGLVVLLKEDCQTCLGKGEYVTDWIPDNGIGWTKKPCPNCDQRGWNPTAQAIEVATAITYQLRYIKTDDEWDDQIADITAEALVAVLSMGDSE